MLVAEAMYSSPTVLRASWRSLGIEYTEPKHPHLAFRALGIQLNPKETRSVAVKHIH
jgi:hypothetical protein